MIRLTDEGIHNIRIDVKDAYNNTSSLRFQVRARPGSIDPYTGKAWARIPRGDAGDADAAVAADKQAFRSTAWRALTARTRSSTRPAR